MRNIGDGTVMTTACLQEAAGEAIKHRVCDLVRNSRCSTDLAVQCRQNFVTDPIVIYVRESTVPIQKEVARPTLTAWRQPRLMFLK